MEFVLWIEHKIWLNELFSIFSHWFYVSSKLKHKAIDAVGNQPLATGNAMTYSLLTADNLCTLTPYNLMLAFPSNFMGCTFMISYFLIFFNNYLLQTNIYLFCKLSTDTLKDCYIIGVHFHTLRPLPILYELCIAGPWINK